MHRWDLQCLCCTPSIDDSTTHPSTHPSRPQTPIFGEHGEPAAKEKIWAKSAVLADYGLDISISGVLQLVRMRVRASYVYMCVWVRSSDMD